MATKIHIIIEIKTIKTKKPLSTPFQSERGYVKTTYYTINAAISAKMA